MSGVSNIRQVISSTQAVERVQETQNRSASTGQQHFADQLRRESEEETRKVPENPDAKRVEEERERSEEEARAQKDRDEESGDEPETDADDERSNPDDEDEEGRHVDVLA